MICKHKQKNGTLILTTNFIRLVSQFGSSRKGWIWFSHGWNSIISSCSNSGSSFSFSLSSLWSLGLASITIFSGHTFFPLTLSLNPGICAKIRPILPSARELISRGISGTSSRFLQSCQVFRRLVWREFQRVLGASGSCSFVLAYDATSHSTTRTIKLSPTPAQIIINTPAMSAKPSCVPESTPTCSSLHSPWACNHFSSKLSKKPLWRSSRMAWLSCLV